MVNIASYETKGGRRWRVRYRKPDGSQTDKRGFKRKLDAENWAAEHVTVAKAHGSYVDPSDGRTSVGALYERWVAAKRISVKPSWLRTIEITWRNHVEPMWGARAVAGIERGEVQQWVGDLSSRRSASLTIRAVQILSGVLALAVDERRITVNPAAGLELPRRRRKQHVYLTAAELERVADAARWRRPIVLTLGLCGMRWGELLAIRVRDVDLDAGRIYIRGSATQVGMRIILDDTKTGRGRLIMFPSVLRPVLAAQMEGRSPDDLLFTAPGHPFDEFMRVGSGSTNSRDGWFEMAMRRADLGRGHMTVHDLRHTAASLMVAAGANVKAVQRQLGHTSAAMTLDTYADLFDDDLTDLSEAMSDMLLRKNVGKTWADGSNRA